MFNFEIIGSQKVANTGQRDPVYTSPMLFQPLLMLGNYTTVSQPGNLHCYNVYAQFYAILLYQITLLNASAFPY